MRLRPAAAWTAALVVASAASASRAQAQQWWQLCTGSGGQNSCAALQVTLTSLDAMSTRVAVRAQNLQGTFANSTGPSVLEQIYLHFGSALPALDAVTDAPVRGPGVSAYGGVGGLVGSAPGAWTVQTNALTVALYADNPDLGYFSDVRGCGGPSPLEDPGWITCGPRGTRWVEFGFDLAASLTDADLQSVGFGTRYNAFGLDEHVCNDEPTPNVACRVERFTPTPSVVPEPATVALLAAGLGALAAGARRRRPA